MFAAKTFGGTTGAVSEISYSFAKTGIIGLSPGFLKSTRRFNSRMMAWKEIHSERWVLKVSEVIHVSVDMVCSVLKGETTNISLV